MQLIIVRYDILINRLTSWVGEEKCGVLMIHNHAYERKQLHRHTAMCQPGIYLQYNDS